LIYLRCRRLFALWLWCLIQIDKRYQLMLQNGCCTAPSLHYHRDRSLGVLLPKLQRTIPSVRSNSRAPSLLTIRR
jgi:hypothetical protein